MMSRDYAEAEWIPTSHYWAGRGGHTPRWIIAHGTAGGSSAQEIARYFQTNSPPTSTHFVVGRDGAVAQCVAESDSAWGNGVVSAGHDSWWSADLNPNFVTFSIEHVKPDGNNATPLTQAQKEASFRLIAHLCERYGIPKRAADGQGGITGHASIDPVNRAFCPGAFPWDELWAYLGGGETVGVPAGWSDNGAQLTAPNGKTVTLGFRWYILTHPWAADNWPLENEHYEAILDITNPQEGAGTVQHFRKSILAWQEGSSDIIDVWSGATSLAWQTRARAAEQRPPSVAAPMAARPVGAGTMGAGTMGAGTMGAGTLGAGGESGASPNTASAGPTRTPAPLTYMPPIQAKSTATARANAATGGGDGFGAVVNAAESAAESAATALGGTGAGDAVAQRVSSIERQLQTLIDGLSTNPKTKQTIQSVERELGVAGQALANPQRRRALLGNPGSLIRWVLMVIGLLFSDAVAWAVSTFLHHQTSLPLPFITVTTVMVSAFLVIAGFSRAQPHS